MTDVVLPRLNQTGSNDWSDVESNDVALREIINGELDNGNLSGSAEITGANLADAAVSSRKFKPTKGIVAAGGDLSLTGTMTDVPGTEKKLTAAVTSILYVTAIFEFEATEAGRSMAGTLRVDSSDQTPRAVAFQVASTGRITASQVYEVELSAAEHTLKLRGVEALGASSGAKVKSANTRFLYELVAK